MASTPQHILDEQHAQVVASHAVYALEQGSADDDTMIDGSMTNDEETGTRAHTIQSLEGQTDIKAEIDTSALHNVPPVPALRKQNSTSRPKTEGLDSDKRYLCHVCNKLFTRRRSVKDHINKIHPGHSFDAERSIEVIVEPGTGLPIDPTVIPELPPSASPVPSPTSATLPPATSVPPALKTETSTAGSRASSIDPFPTPAPIIGKKRPAPSSVSSQPKTITKKGTASKVKNHTTPVSKRLKTSDSDGFNGTPMFRSPSGTPASSRVKQSPAPKTKNEASASVASSPAPSDSRMSVDAASEHDEGDTPNTNDDNEVFCICRKGDNHTWMIACDGQCEDWYHGKCVGIEERDGDLIDKYICPSCKREGFQTTWKRMCRRKACRKPARVTDDPPSKYCSSACGAFFFVEMVQRSDPDALASPNGRMIIDPLQQKKYRKKKRKPTTRHIYAEGDDMDVDQNEEESPYPSPPRASVINGHLKHTLEVPDVVTSDEDASNVEYETDTSSDEEPLPSRGGALRAGEIAALVRKYNVVEKWRDEIGKRPSDAPLDVHGNTKLILDEFEKRHFATIATKIARLRLQAAELTARETLLGLVKKRSAFIIEKARKEHPKQKDICGFDPRLSWPDTVFEQWRNGSDGIKAFASESLGAPAEPVKDETGNDSDDDDEDEEQVSGGSATMREGVCIKNRCARHAKWRQVQMAEIRFEMDRIGRSIDILEREEAGIKERAILRAWEEHAE